MNLLLPLNHHKLIPVFPSSLLHKAVQGGEFVVKNILFIPLSSYTYGLLTAFIKIITHITILQIIKIIHTFSLLPMLLTLLLYSVYSKFIDPDTLIKYLYPKEILRLFSMPDQCSLVLFYSVFACLLLI
jgi:hypothetical protein